MSLNAERWRIVKAVFAEISDLPPAERAERLRSITFDDGALRDEVAALLKAAGEVGDRFERVPVAGLAALQAEAVVEGTVLGPYRVVREIGRGGMGTVYEALRADAEFHKRVALKMVAPGSGTDAILRRFRYERQILARLEHRNIAALLDGGVSASGQPYFAMEFVEGIRIDRYSASRRLGVQDRLKLFRQVCAAVHYAHQNLVVHRDLKPSNILVTADGTVKLLDFGIAKLLEPGPDEDPLTRSGVAPMTTAYASPEQLAGQPVTTASDVYSLGVLLYELLAGKPPFETAGLPVLEVRRRMAERTPTPPSRVASVESISSAAEPTTRRLQRALAGELDNIVLMALRKEPERRYPSAEALAEDVLRFMAGLPIQATPDSLGYRIGKLARRNRLAVAAMSLALVATVAGAAVSLWQAASARAALVQAQQERNRAQAIADFFREVLTQADPTKGGRAVTVIEAIERTIPRIDSAFANDLWIRASLKSAIGATLHDLGLPEAALPLDRDALALQTQLDSGRVTYDGATMVYNLAGVEQALGRPAAAESLYRASLAMYESIPGIDPGEIAIGWGQLGILLGQQGRNAEELELQGRVVALLRTRGGRERSLAIALSNYATSLTELGRLAEAEALHREAVALLERGDPDDSALGGLLQPFAVSLLYAGHLAEAESVARRSYRLAAEEYGAANPNALVAQRALLNVLVDAGRCPEVLERSRTVIGLRGTGLSETDLTLGSAYLTLGQCLASTGDLAGGERAVREALTLRLATLPPDHWAVGQVRSVLGEIMVRHGRPDGRGELTAGLALIEASLGKDHYRTRQARDRLAGR